MKLLISRCPVLFYVTSAVTLLSVAVLPTALAFGLAYTSYKAVPGYFDKLNWVLQPLFYPVLAFLVHVSWHQYRKAWEGLPSRSILYRGEALEGDPHASDGLVSALTSYRPLIVGISICAGLILSAVDAGCLWSEYSALGDPGPACREVDFTVAFRLWPYFGHISTNKNLFFVIVAYVLQGGLIAYGWLALSQLTLHTYCFARFETLRFARQQNLSIRFNYRDRLHEFGMSDFNRAINITYVSIALGMAIPVLSALSQDSLHPPDFGQWLLRILLPLILLVPSVIPFVDRVLRVLEAEQRVGRDPDPAAPDEYIKQRLWPFEETQIGYVGKIAAGLALGEYIYLITLNIRDIF